jgi:hypothetical protein
MRATPQRYKLLESGNLEDQATSDSDNGNMRGPIYFNMYVNFT